MDKELINYIITYHSDLMTGKEQLGLKHLMAEIKIEDLDNVETRENIEREMIHGHGYQALSD